MPVGLPTERLRVAQILVAGVHAGVADGDDAHRA